MTSTDSAGWEGAYSSNGANTVDTGPTSTSEAPPDEPTPQDAESEKNDAPPAPMYKTLEEWVTAWLAPMITVEVGSGIRWCAEWWRHEQAVARLESLWREWEVARISDEMSAWWRDHADPHLDALVDAPRSPFRQCSGQPGGHRDALKPLPVEPAEPGWFG